jgi:DNA adenine methylase
MNNKHIKPPLKWAGGKSQIKSIIIEEIKKYYNDEATYFEPFLGGGAILFSLQPKKAVVNDINKELINVYKIIKNYPNQLIEELEKFKKNDSNEFYYKVREWDRKEDFNSLDKIKLAGRTIYLNKTCYNGLYRVNQRGYFNTPRGKYLNPQIYDENNIDEIHKYFKANNIKIISRNYSMSVNAAKAKDIIYFDPPYDYEDSGFTQYSKSGFSKRRLNNLKKLCDKLIEKGCIVFISNNNTKYVRSLFAEEGYEIIYVQKIIKANRVINSNGAGRTKVEEVLIRGLNKEKNLSSSE